MKLPKTSPFTQVLAIVVLVSMGAVVYYGQRVKPSRARIARDQANVERLQESRDRTREQVARMRSEAALAERWMHFAQTLDRQSTGRSLDSLLRTCGTPGRPRVAVDEFRLGTAGAAEPTQRFRRRPMTVQVKGPFLEVLGLLRELDRAFPPVVLTHTSFRAVVDEADAVPTDDVEATLEGHVYEIP